MPVKRETEREIEQKLEKGHGLSKSDRTLEMSENERERKRREGKE